MELVGLQALSCWSYRKGGTAGWAAARERAVTALHQLAPALGRRAGGMCHRAFHASARPDPGPTASTWPASAYQVFLSAPPASDTAIPRTKPMIVTVGLKEWLNRQGCPPFQNCEWGATSALVLVWLSSPGSASPHGTLVCLPAPKGIGLHNKI